MQIELGAGENSLLLNQNPSSFMALLPPALWKQPQHAHELEGMLFSLHSFPGCISFDGDVFTSRLDFFFSPKRTASDISCQLSIAARAILPLIKKAAALVSEPDTVIPHLCTQQNMKFCKGSCFTLVRLTYFPSTINFSLGCLCFLMGEMNLACPRKRNALGDLDGRASQGVCSD